MNSLLYIIFFISGISALIFETLWFRLSGLAFGNSVWSVTIVLSSFMGGLAIGNAASAHYGYRFKYPVRIYAILEIIISITGFLLVLTIPVLTGWLSPLFRLFLNNQPILNVLRLIIVFVLLLIPSCAMGITLPVLVKAIHGESNNLGQALGKLYGVNTLGSVVGALIGDPLLVKFFGIQGTGLIASIINGACAGAVLLIFKFNAAQPVDAYKIASHEIGISEVSPPSMKLLIASCFAGGTLLALEVIWFRFLILFFNPHAIILSIMLAIVLAGIGIGGVLASQLYRFRIRPSQFIYSVSLLSGIIIILSYRSFHFGLSSFNDAPEYIRISLAFLYLMFPVSLFSGVIFTSIGDALYQNVREEIKTVGLLALSNTLGAMVGSFTAGFILIPKIGLEKSFFIMALAYGFIALSVINREQLSFSNRAYCLNHAITGIFLLLLIIFPFGLMEKTFLKEPIDSYKTYFNKEASDIKVVAVREGLTETIQYLREDLWGEPYYYILITNSHPMASTDIKSRRFRKLFVYLPMALNPKIRKALVICYGAGVTAKALSDTKSLETIDIVDISRDTIEMGKVMFSNPQDNPVHDKRARIHIEDGRFFLQTTQQRFDLITSEPPPPKNTGVVNLYTQEYFQLLYDHLNDGGVVTYWLPVQQLREKETNSILKAFCNVFSDCSLWSGAGFELMMAGTKNIKGPVPEKDFTLQWNDESIKSELQATGVETPEQLCLLLMADAQALKELTRNTLPLTDNYPKRLITEVLSPAVVDFEEYRNWSLALSNPEQFRASSFIEKIWPAELKNKCGSYSKSQKIINEFMTIGLRAMHYNYFFDSLYTILSQTSLQTAVFIIMGSDADLQGNIDRAMDKGIIDYEMYYHLAVRALANRDYASAEEFFSSYQKFSPDRKAVLDIYLYRIFTLSMMGQREKAFALTQEFFSQADTYEINNSQNYWTWLQKTFGYEIKVPLRRG